MTMDSPGRASADAPGDHRISAWRGRTFAAVTNARAVVLVEGASDQEAVRALAARRGTDLDRAGIAIVAMGGASNIGRVLDLLVASRREMVLAGLFDVGEVRAFQRAFERAGLGSGLGPADLEALGFYRCVEDLEDELIRHLGVKAVEAAIAAQDELGAYRIFQRQPAQRGRSDEQQLRRFMGTRSGRKIRYGRLLVEALDPDRIPLPLEAVLARVSPAA